MARLERVFEALREGDASALDAHLADLRARLKSFAERRLDEDRAEEAVQETLVTLWEKRTAVRDADHLMPFVFRVLRNKIGNVYSRAGRERGRRSDSNDSEALADERSAPLGPAAAYAGLELEELIARAVRRCRVLSPGSAELLELLWQGLSPGEIRRRLGMPPESTLLSRVHRARRLLRRVLREEFGYDVAGGHAGGD